VRHHVVQFAGDGAALGGPRGPALRLAPALLLGDAFGGLPTQVPAGADDQAQQQRQTDHDGEAEHRLEELLPRLTDREGEVERGEQAGPPPHRRPPAGRHGHFQQRPARADLVDRLVVEDHERHRQQGHLDEQPDLWPPVEEQGEDEGGHGEQPLLRGRLEIGMGADHQVTDAAEIQ
jgi:hypothetical protein